uniref:Rap-GAP domain-containing protein n=1 Tax=Parascaris univalens TaxID=6257 RepID=A0A915AUQ5_PARUN
ITSFFLVGTVKLVEVASIPQTHRCGVSISFRDRFGAYALFRSEAEQESTLELT